LEKLKLNILTPNGVKPNNRKVKTVQEFPQLKSAQEVKGFLGLVNFYRNHVRDLRLLARPLNELTRTDKTTGRIVGQRGARKHFKRLRIAFQQHQYCSPQT